MLIESVFSEFSDFMEIEDCDFETLSKRLFEGDKSLMVVRYYGENGDVLGYRKRTEIVRVSKAVFERNRLGVQACFFNGSTYFYYFMKETCVCCYESKFEEIDRGRFDDFMVTQIGLLYYYSEGFAKILIYKGL